MLKDLFVLNQKSSFTISILIMNYNSTIRQKTGLCDCCGRQSPLIAGKCPYCYKSHRNKINSEKRKKTDKELGVPELDNGWFLERRKAMTGICQCGCGKKSSKDDEKWFRASCCHIFPKAHFLSVANHPLNFVERNFWEGCHAQMDNRSIEKWVEFEDWGDIKTKVRIMEPNLTPEEKGRKFYSILMKLVNEQ